MKRARLQDLRTTTIEIKSFVHPPHLSLTPEEWKRAQTEYKSRFGVDTDQLLIRPEASLQGTVVQALQTGEPVRTKQEFMKAYGEARDRGILITP